MRADPLDLADAQYIWAQAGWQTEDVRQIVRSARIPDIDELKDQFDRCVRILLAENETV